MRAGKSRRGAGSKDEPLSDIVEIQRISSTKTMMRLADSVLSLDRETISVAISAYLYFASSGADRKQFLLFMATKERDAMRKILVKILPPFLSGVLTESTFRSVILAMARAVISGPERIVIEGGSGSSSARSRERHGFSN